LPERLCGVLKLLNCFSLRWKLFSPKDALFHRINFSLLSVEEKVFDEKIEMNTEQFLEVRDRSILSPFDGFQGSGRLKFSKV